MEKYIGSDGKERIFDEDEVRKMAKTGQKIPLIKELRYISGMGLKDSKDAVEKFQTNLGYDIDGLVDMFKEHANIPSFDPLTKEEMLNMVGEVLDNMEAFHYTDMLEAIETMITNIRKKGGLDAVAKERDKFLKQI